MRSPNDRDDLKSLGGDPLQVRVLPRALATLAVAPLRTHLRDFPTQGHPVRSRPLVAGLTAGLLGSLVLVGCALTDVFDRPGPAADIIFVFSDSLLTVGDTVPFVVVVRTAAGDLANPHLRVTSLNPALLEVNTRGDTLMALGQGRALLDVQLVSSVITGAAPDTVTPIRVRP